MGEREREGRGGTRGRERPVRELIASKQSFADSVSARYPVKIVVPKKKKRFYSACRLHGGLKYFQRGGNPPREGSDNFFLNPQIRGNQITRARCKPRSVEAFHISRAARF